MKTYSRKKGESPSNVIFNINELCRLCLAKEEKLVSIFDNEGVPLPLRIMGCIDLEVTEKMAFTRTKARARFSCCDVADAICEMGGGRFFLEGGGGLFRGFSRKKNFRGGESRRATTTIFTELSTFPRRAMQGSSIFHYCM